MLISRKNFVKVMNVLQYYRSFSTSELATRTALRSNEVSRILRELREDGIVYTEHNRHRFTAEAYQMIRDIEIAVSLFLS